LIKPSVIINENTTFKLIRDIGKVVYNLSHLVRIFVVYKVLPKGKAFKFLGGTMRFKTKILDEVAIKRTLVRMTHEIIEKNKGVENLCLLGVKSRGVPLAKMLHDNILAFEGIDVPIGFLDTTRHRDDLSEETKNVKAGECHFPCDVTDKIVVIVDDVMFTGRTTRAAIEAVFAFARPKAIQLAVLIDRGHRELPFKPDFVGKNVPTSSDEKIVLLLNETDGQDGAFICDVE
jgi:pyrimidine operon attenuation protein/uracil phosphoribosyltransferase